MRNYFKIFGEMASKLRNTVIGLDASFSGSYSLNSVKKVNYTMTKELYYNTLDAYKLGAGFAKPIVNTTAGFCGVPAIVTKDKSAQDTIDAYNEQLHSILLIAERNSFRDGDSYLRLLRLKNDKLLYKGEETSIKAFLIPPESVTIVPDAITGEERQYIIKTHIIYQGDAFDPDRKYNFYVTEIITRDQFITKYTGRSIPLDLHNNVETNTWGFIPIIHFKNSAEPEELYGRSDLEAVEPFMKAYHDVMLQGLQSNKQNSTPKVKLKLDSVSEFLEHNFTASQIAEAKRTGQLKFNKDLYLLNVDEDLGFVEVKSAVGSAEVLLKFLFYCIIDVSQVPEFAFGTAVKSSKASVSEQLVPLEKKIEMKRVELTQYYQRLVRILLAMTTEANAKAFTTYASSLEWVDVSPTDEEKSAKILKDTVEALGNALDHLIISQEAATDTLATIVPAMHSFLSDDKDVIAEKERILTGKVITDRVNDGFASDLIEKAALKKKGAEKNATK